MNYKRLLSSFLIMVLIGLILSRCTQKNEREVLEITTEINTEKTSNIVEMDGIWVDTLHMRNTFFLAKIEGNKICIVWHNNNNVNSLYWSGSFETSETKAEYSLISMSNISEAQKGFLTSTDASKQFYYSDGRLSFEYSMLGKKNIAVLAKDLDSVYSFPNNIQGSDKPTQNDFDLSFSPSQCWDLRMKIERSLEDEPDIRIGVTTDSNTVKVSCDYDPVVLNYQIAQLLEKAYPILNEQLKEIGVPFEFTIWGDFYINGEKDSMIRIGTSDLETWYVIDSHNFFLQEEISFADLCNYLSK